MLFDHEVFGESKPNELTNMVTYQNKEILLEDDQMEAIRGIRAWLHSTPRQPYVRLSGYAGTGKTVCIAYLIQNALDILPNDIRHRKICVCTFTWKASLVLRSRGVNSQSIHSIFYAPRTTKEGEVVFEPRPVSEIRSMYSMIIVDEASMVSADIRQTIENIDIPVLYVGDAAQLPEISTGFNKSASSSKDFMEDSEFNLTKIRRQALESPIIRLSIDIREGKFIPYGKYGDGVFKIEHEELSDSLLLKSDQLIVGKNATRNYLNNYVRELLGYDVTSMPTKGEKLVGLNNLLDRGCYNGQEWIAMDDYSKYPLKTSRNINMTISNPNIEDDLRVQACVFPDDTINDSFDSTSQLARFLKDNKYYQVDFGYALTCHKCQGSSFKKPIVFEEYLGNKKFHKKWLYTAVTRAEEKLIIVS